MGLFDKEIELTKDDFDKINAILPPELRKDSWKSSEIIDKELTHKFRRFRDKMEIRINEYVSKQ